MYPQFQLLGVTVHVFGLALAASLGMFLWMSYRLAGKIQVDKKFISDNVLWMILSAVVISRIAFFVAEWREYKFLFSEGSWFRAIFMSDYNLSLAGALAGFAGLFALKTRSLRKKDRLGYMDVFVLSFLFCSTVGYLGALLGGQVYGVTVEQANGWGITYSHPATPVPGESARFPLAAIYLAVSFLLFWTLYVAHVLTRVSGLVGYAGAVSFGSMILVGEFFNGDTDMFRSSFLYLNLNQLAALATIVFGLKGLLSIAKNS